MKKCSKCRSNLPISEFRKDSSRKDGFSYVCKTCLSKKDYSRYYSDIDAQRQRGVEYYWKDPEARRLQNKKKYWENVDYYRQLDRSYYWFEPEKKREKTKKWRMNNKTKVIAYNSIRRTEKINACPKWLSSIELAQIQEFYDIANARTVQTGIMHHVDHIHPLRGKNFMGIHVPWNLQVLTAKENMSKRNKLPMSEANLAWSK